MERKPFTQEELETIWLRLNGQLTDQGDVPNLFAENLPCDLLYGQVFDARERIAQRTGIGFEDRDILEIVQCLEEIGKLCAFALYHYAVGETDTAPCAAPKSHLDIAPET